MGTSSVDPDALRFAAQRLEEAADLIGGAISGDIGDLPAHRALDRLLAGLVLWQRAARDTASALRVGADRCAAAEDGAVRRLR